MIRPRISTTTEYGIWVGMKRRCYDANHHTFNGYGSRGIKVCDRWRESFAAFVADMGQRPAGCSLDRIDNNGDYSPANCRWADRVTQNRNSSHNVRLAAFGETKLLCEWASDPRCLTTYKALHNRLARGWNPEKAITTPLLRHTLKEAR